jgi:hypothetical protein
MPDQRPAQPPPELRAKVLELVRQVPSPSRREAQRRSVGWLSLGLLLPLLLFMLLGGAERGPRPLSLLLITGVGSGLLALVSLWGALGRGGRTLGRARSRLLAVVLLPPLLLLLCKLACSAEFPNMSEAWALRPGLRCFGVSLLFGAAPLVALLLARRGSDPVHPGALGAALGAAGGLWAATLVDLWCPVAFPLHVVLGHVLPALLLAALGALAGARLLSTNVSLPQR